ncbi:MAG: PKD domain-containing protein [Bacteroidia bacterium]
MILKLRPIVIVFMLLFTSWLHAQQQVSSRSTNCPGVPGACGYVPNHSAMHTGPAPTPQNGNGTLGLVYTNTACGLNYAVASRVLGKRFSPQGVNQPAAFSITGMPAGACVLKAYLWAEGSGDGSAQTATIVNPSAASANYPMAVVGQGPDKCWGYAGSYTYRADVTASVSGNGNYNISGILTNPPTSGNDMDGATLMVIWSDASQSWKGTVRVDDGAFVVNGGIANYVMTYPAVCGVTTNASAFMCVGDIQFNPNSWTLNGTAAPITWNWYDMPKVNTTVAAGQTTSAFNVNSSGDCFNLCVAGLYYRTTCVLCSPPVLTMSSTPATCSGCNGTATVSIAPAGSYTYTWSPSGGTGTTATGLCAGTYTVTAVSGCNTYTASVVVANAGGGLTVTGSQTNVTCFGACNGTATTTVTGGTAPYTFIWTPAHASITAGATNTATALCAGTYTISVTDFNGCTGSRTITITQPPQITATQSQVNVTCNGSCNGSATVVAAGGNGTYTYAWAPSGGTAATASGLCAGTYTCTISSPAGCSITQSFTITQPPVITATQSQVNVTCNAACTGSATVVASGGTGTYTYAWAPTGGTGATASGLCAGTYTCNISSPVGCSITSVFTITQPPAITATQSQVNVTCNGVCNGTATVVASGGTGTYTYAWAPSGGTAATASGLCAGTYTCTISSPVGCSITSVFTITQPPAITATQSQVNVTCNAACTGSATVVASGGNGTYSYAWAPTGGTAATASGLCAGTYTCTISSPVGCSITSVFTITQPPAITATQSQVNVTCNGSCNGSATVVASGGTGTYTYAWAPSGGTSATASGLCAGTYTCTISSPAGCSITKIFTITQPPVITATQSQVNVTCNGVCNGSATVVASGGTGTYTYAWAPSGGTAATASGLCAGTYTCTISSPAGCSITQSFTITQPPAITVTQSQVNVTCNAACTGSATVVASGGTGTYTYAWVPSGGTAATASGLCAGTYTCTISSPAGCSITSVFTITQPPAITATQSQTNVTCNGVCNGTATVIASGGNGTYTYAWAPSGGTASTASGLCAGTYTCTISSPVGCSITKTITITQPTVITATTSSVQATCGNPNGSATVVPSGGTPSYTYSWAPSGGTGATATGLTAGSYTCTITDANGCVITKTVSVTNAGSPTATITATLNVTCFGGNNGSATVSASGGSSPYTYAWAPSGGTGTTASGLTANTYTVTVTDANGCSTIATVTITAPPALTATQSQVNITCNAVCNGSATVVPSGGSPGYTYAWTPTGGTAATTSGRCAGTYTCTITDANGCSITKTFNITQPTAVTATTATTPVLCNGGTTGTASVTASGGTPTYTYSWSPSGGTGASATGLAVGSYTCTITDANGCSITRTISVTQPTVITATSTTVNATCGNPNGSATVTPSGGTPTYTYSWAPSGGTSATATGLLAGTYTCTITDANGCTITSSVTIVNAGSPTAAISASTNILCFGGNNGSATVTATGGTSPYTYAWAPSGGTSATASSLIAGSYTVTVTDANGCSTTATVTLTQPPVIAATAVSTPALCNGGTTGTATVAASGGTPSYTYLWAPSGGTGATATGIGAGTYTCTVTDANGCTRTATVSVTQPTAVTATISNTPVLCNGGTTGTASVTASGGTPAYTYAWAPSGGTGSVATGLAAGSYTCTITDANGCSITKTITVTQPTVITATSTTVTATCGNPNGSATVTPSGGTPTYSYSWAPSGGTSATASGLVAGTYTCTITDANGCTITSSVTIVNAGSPTAAISASTNILCFGGNNGSATVTASGGTSPYTYVWAPSGGTGTTASSLIAGSYTVTVTDANGCSTTASVTLTQPPVLAATAVSTPVLCNGGTTGTATVAASGGTLAYTYSWAPSGGTAATATGLAAATYTCTVTDANGCTTTATTTVSQPTQLTATISTTPVLCNGGNTGTATVVATNGTPGYTYSWAPSGGIAATATGLTAGTYTCTITDANGCMITSSITVTQPTAIALTTSFVQSTCGNPNGQASVVATGGTPTYSYSWAPTGGTGSTATGLTAQVYTVTVTDANGCVTTATVNVPNAGSPTATITASTNVSCFGGNNGDATVTGSGGTPPYTYAWSPTGGTGQTGTGLIAGSYTVTLTDANGCSATASVIITEPPMLTATATSIPVLCNAGNTGNATVIGAGGVTPYSYLWAPSGGTGSTAPNLFAGTYTCTVTDANGCTTTASITVTEPTQLTSTISATPVLCNAGNTGSATVSASNATPGYTYSWAPSGGTNAIASSLVAGGYTCTITDANGCFITASITVTEPTAVTLVTAFVQSTCGNPNGQASVVANNGTPGYTYSWTPSGGTNATATGLLAGGYTVNVTDANGCVTLDSVNVLNAGTPVATITSSTNVLCFGGNNGDATVTVTGAGNPPYNYSWSPIGGTGATGTGLIAGSYTVSVTDANGCSDVDSVIITEPPVLTATAFYTAVLCNAGNTGTATVIGTGGVTAYSYAWAPSGGSNATEQSLIAGSYTCTITDANGCTTTASTTVTEPTQLTTTFSQVDERCFGGNTASAMVTPADGTPGYTYSWAPSGGTGSSASSLVTGTYTCTISDANGCFITQSFTITEPTQVVVSTVTVDAHCNLADGSATASTVGGIGPYTYAWSLPSTGDSIVNVTNGTYTVIAVDANGCADTTTAVINNLNGVNASLTSVTNLTCFQSGDGEIITGSTGGVNPYTYAWTAPASSTTDTASGLPAGSYTLEVTDASGCTSTVTAVVTEPTLVTIGASAAPTAVCAGSGVVLSSTPAGGTPALNVVWTPGSMTGNTQNIIPAATTTYTATVTDANGCTASATTLVTVYPMPAAAFIADVTSGCAQLCVNFADLSAIAAPGNIVAWDWDFGDGNTSTSQVTSHCYPLDGVYTVTLTVKSADGCSNTLVLTNYITVFDNPVAAFGSFPQPTTILNPTVSFTDSSSFNVSSWVWSFGDILNSASVLQNPDFTYGTADCFLVLLTVTTPNGCWDTVSHPVCIDPDASIYVPNAFTPDGNGNNELFFPVTIGMDPDQFEMWIYDRWGNLIYYTNDLNDGWDGRVQGHSEISQIDTYVWKINAVDLTGKKHNLLGKVSLIK